MSGLRTPQHADDADECVPLLLRLPRLRCTAETANGRLLCVLLIWRRALSAYAAAAANHGACELPPNGQQLLSIRVCMPLMFRLHKSQDKQDFVFTYDKLNVAER
jgi:hypothetical protein